MPSVKNIKKAGFIVAAPSSGSGKTAFTLGIMEALRRRGLDVRPFKAGPDYIDAGLHAALLNKPSYNLDTWMMGSSGVKRTFAEKARGGIGVIEGVMGLYDGRGTDDAGSTAHLSKTLRLPVLLVVNAEKMSRSAGALIKGFAAFDRRVNIRWVVFNKVGSVRHFEILKDSIPKSSNIKCAGYLPKDARLVLPERHLGLTGAGDLKRRAWRHFIDSVALVVERHVDIDMLLRSISVNEKTANIDVTRKNKKTKKIRIAVARDSAFSFYYQENLDLLESLGAELKFFSPIKSKSLPAGTGGIYLGGGYPELHAKELEANKAMRARIKAFADAGGPIYAECGGLMYLCKSIEADSGKVHAMAGVFPMAAEMLARRRSLGYRTVSVNKGCPFLSSGTLCGHEFHYSDIKDAGSGVKRCFDVSGAAGQSKEGYLYKNTLATYVHLHFASNQAFAAGFVALARKPDKV